MAPLSRLKYISELLASANNELITQVHTLLLV